MESKRVIRKNLTKAQRLEIAKRAEAGEPASKIAKDLGRSYSGIREIILNPEGGGKSGPKSKYAIDETFLDEIDTEEKAYFLGWMYADGCNSHDSGRFLISLQERDGHVLELFKKFMKSNHKLYFSGKKKDHHQNQLCFTVSSRRLSDNLAKWGVVQAKTFKITWPEWLPKHLWKAFIRGVFEGDGRIRDSIDIVATESFCQSLRDVIKEVLSIEGYLRKTVSDGICRFSLTKQKDAEKFARWLYEDATFYLERKYQAWLNLVDHIEKAERKKYERSHNEDGSIITEEQKAAKIASYKAKWHKENKPPKGRNFLKHPDGTLLNEEERKEHTKQVNLKSYLKNKESRLESQRNRRRAKTLEKNRLKE